jgi:hypothetical protein
MEMKSTYPGLLLLPDGAELRAGDSVEIGYDLAANAGVAGWIESGWLVDASGYRPPAPDVKVEELILARNVLVAENADLGAQLAALQADLDAATKPRK